MDHGTTIECGHRAAGFFFLFNSNIFFFINGNRAASPWLPRKCK
jgi:hypothetical protein